MNIDYSIDLDDFVATVDASKTVAEFDRELVEYDLMSHLQAPYDMAITDALAQDWGHNARQVLGLYVQHFDGSQSKTGGKVIKNVSGYDLSKLYIGSCNHLAKIVAASLRLDRLPKFQTEITVPVFDLEQAVLQACDLSTRDFDDYCDPSIQGTELKFRLAAVKEELLELKVKRLLQALGKEARSSEILEYQKDYPKSAMRLELHAVTTELAAIAKQLDRPCEILPKQGYVLLDGCTEEIRIDTALSYNYPLKLTQEQANAEHKLLEALQEQYRGPVCAN